jgi:hypothetical protein
MCLWSQCIFFKYHVRPEFSTASRCPPARLLRRRCSPRPSRSSSCPSRPASQLHPFNSPSTQRSNARGPNSPSRFTSRQRSMYKSFVLHPFIERLRAHPGFASADRELIAEAEAHPAYCLASRAFLQRWEAMLRCRHSSRAPAQQWNVYGSGIWLRQRRALLYRGALCAVLVRRLMRIQGVYRVRNVLHHDTVQLQCSSSTCSSAYISSFYIRASSQHHAATRAHGSSIFRAALVSASSCDSARDFAHANSVVHQHQRCHAARSGVASQRRRRFPIATAATSALALLTLILPQFTNASRYLQARCLCFAIALHERTAWYLVPYLVHAYILLISVCNTSTRIRFAIDRFNCVLMHVFKIYVLNKSGARIHAHLTVD